MRYYRLFATTIHTFFRSALARATHGLDGSMSIRGVRKIQFAEFRESEGRGGGVTLVKGKLFADGIRQPELSFVLFSLRSTLRDFRIVR